MKHGGIVKNPFQTELFERFSELTEVFQRVSDKTGRRLAARVIP
jgi:hypothetical protein